METAKVSVVLVDDSTDVRTLVRMRLESSGLFDVLGEAGDGEEAIELVVRHHPDAVLLDVSMPAMDGLETLPAILAVRPETSVVMFSGFGGTDLTAELGELGALDYIEKSIPLEQLPDRLFRSLRGGAPEPEPPAEEPEPVPSPDPVTEPLDDLDVTRVEQSILDEHVEGFRALFDRAAIGMATLTIDATIVRANEALADLMSCEPSDLVGVDYGRLTVGHGHDLDHRLEGLRSSQASVATFEHPIPAPPGATTARTALVTLVPIRDSVGELLYVFAQVQDITAQRLAEDELHRSEAYFRLLVAAVEDYAIFMLDPHGTVASWNAGARRIKGYDADEIVGQHFRVFYPQDQQLTGHPERNLEAALRHGSFAEDGWRVRKDGTAFWASVVISAVHDEKGRHIGFAKITRDQTEQRQNVEDRLEAAAEQARLLAVTAHELRNPTAVIDGSAHLLETSHEDMSDHERHQFFRGIRSSTERLRRLTANLERLNLWADALTADAATWKPDELADAVLLDAPCSATGTFRRHPEVLYRARPRIIAENADLQAQLLVRAADFVKPGGVLVYAVCSLEPQEGEQVIVNFTANHPLRIMPPEPGELPDFVTPSADGTVRILPGLLEAEGGLDGFFIARLVRRG